MSVTLKAVLILLTIIYMIFILRTIHQKKMNISFSIFWLVLCVILIFFAFQPQFIEDISRLLGFEKPSNMIFVITIFLAFYFIFNLTIVVTKESQKNTLLIQEVSLLKQKVSDLQKELDNLDNKKIKKDKPNQNS